jgi:hypothetical protein
MNGHLGRIGQKSDIYIYKTNAYFSVVPPLLNTFIIDVNKELLIQAKRKILAVEGCVNRIRVSAFAVKSSKNQHQVLHIVILSSSVSWYSRGCFSRMFKVIGVKYSWTSLFLQIYR